MDGKSLVKSLLQSLILILIQIVKLLVRVRVKVRVWKLKLAWLNESLKAGKFERVKALTKNECMHARMHIKGWLNSQQKRQKRQKDGKSGKEGKEGKKVR